MTTTETTEIDETVESATGETAEAPRRRRPRRKVSKTKDFTEHTDEQIAQEAQEKGVHSPELTREEQIQRLVESSYPVYPVPKVREQSVRGQVMGAFVGRDGEPTSGIKRAALVKQLIDSGKIDTEDKATRVIELYSKNLVRYHGFHLSETKAGHMKVTKR